MNQNAQCLANKILPIQVILEENDVDVLLISEHWQTNENISSLSFTSYKLQSFFCRSQSTHGGVAIYCKHQLDVKYLPVSEYCLEGIFECACVEIPHLRIIIVVIYRPPAGNFNLFLQQCNNLLTHLWNPGKCLILGGDFNIDFLAHSSNRVLFTDLLVTHNLNKTINTPTRISNFSKTCIDNFFVNIPYYKFDTNNINLHLSDHFSQFLLIDLNVTKSKLGSYNSRYGRKINEENTKKFCNYLENENWHTVLAQQCPNMAFNSFINTFLYYFDLSFPLTRFTTNKQKNDSRWITDELLELKNKVCMFSDLAQKYPELRVVCRELNDEYKLKLKKAKCAYYDNKINGSNNKMKTMWNVISEIQGKESIRKIELFENNVQINDLEAANRFNTHFTKLDTNNSSTKDVNFLNSNILMSEKTFFLSPVTEHEVISFINKLKPSNSCGFDEISNNLIKKCKLFIYIPLTFVINLCFEKGEFPNKLKIAKVLPLHKKGDVNVLSNYRAISLLSGFSKLLELSINEQLMNFFVMNKILMPAQHGFMKTKNVDTALFEYNTHILNAIDKKIIPFGLFVDFSRAFDCVDHELLLLKLNRYGVRGHALNIIKSFLSNRYQIVEINGKKSNSCLISRGVPQGSILGPLLYLIFANDLALIIQRIPNTHLICYADDTNMLIVEKDATSGLNTMHIVYEKIVLWSEKNFLELNQEKTVKVMFSHNYNFNKNNIINNTNFNFSQSAKILGVIFDHNLQWTNHIDLMCDKLRKNCYALRSIKYHCSLNVLLTLYYANIHSTIRYGILNWGTCRQVQRVFILQKYAIRILEGLSRGESCRDHFKKLSILTVFSVYIYEICCFVFKHKYLFQRNQINHEHSTRFRNTLIPDQHATAFYQKGPMYNGCKFFNFLPNTIKQSGNINSFKRNIKKFLIEKNCYSLEEFFV